jgi:hypothetical protein
MKDVTLIKSYVGRVPEQSYFVSTIYRRSSGIFGGMFYETLSWSWNPVTKERGQMIHIETNSRSDPTYRAAALMHHAEICARLSERNPEFSEDDEEMP